MKHKNETVVSVIIIFSEAISRATLKTLGEVLHGNFSHYELLVIGSPSPAFLDIEAEPELLPNARFLLANSFAADYVLFQMAMEHTIGDYIVLFNPEEVSADIIIDLVKKNCEPYDFVGLQYNYNDDSIYAFFSKLLSHALRWIIGYKIDQSLATTASLSRGLVNAITEQDLSMHTSLKMMLALLNPRWAILPNKINRRPYSFLDIFHRISSYFEVISSAPQRILSLVSWLSFVMFLLNLFYIIYAMCAFFFFSSVQEGWTSTSLFLSLLGLGIFFSIYIFSAIFSNQLNCSRQKRFFITREWSHEKKTTDFSKLNVTDNCEE